MTVLRDTSVAGAALTAQLQKRCLLLPVDYHLFPVCYLLYLGDSFDPETF